MSGLRDVTALERPDGTLLPTTGDRVTVPAEAGVYFLRRQAARIGALVVNAEPMESDLRGVGGPESESGSLATLVQGTDVAVAATPSAWRQAVFSRAAGQALLLPLVALALAALLAEAWISGR